MHQPSYDLCKIFVADHLAQNATLRVADVGAADVNGTYKPLFARDGWEYVGFDQSPGKNVDVVMTAETIAERANSFDVVISGQTLEHVRMPWVWIHDVKALAKPGGLIWIIAPNTFQYHAYPLDCWRVFPDGLEALFEWAELEMIYSRMVGIDTFGLARKK
jgi:2-polyprenyl-3-methyl-5-hydroxy-6-metoxy-1,4-benzoquinol methylase